ncbi:hypothetical protein H0H92_012145 [Tricholoma furcatifolium]|nr:hypothetical protein H0H92_012145 [Tricholoma furcatifolium]
MYETLQLLELWTRTKGKGKARDMGPPGDEYAAVLLQHLYDAEVPETLGSKMFGDSVTQETVRLLLDKLEKSEAVQVALQEKVNEMQHCLFSKATGMRKWETTSSQNPGNIKKAWSHEESMRKCEVDPQPLPALHNEAGVSGVSSGEDVVAHNRGPPQGQEEDDADYHSYPHYDVQEYLRDPPDAEPHVVVEFSDLSEFMTKGLTPYMTHNNLDSVTHQIFLMDYTQDEGPGGSDDNYESNSDGVYDTSDEEKTRVQWVIRVAKKEKQGRRRETEKAQKAAFQRKWDSKHWGNTLLGWMTVHINGRYERSNSFNGMLHSKFFLDIYTNVVYIGYKARNVVEASGQGLSYQSNLQIYEAAPRGLPMSPGEVSTPG